MIPKTYRIEEPPFNCTEGIKNVAASSIFVTTIEEAAF